MLCPEPIRDVIIFQGMVAPFHSSFKCHDTLCLGILLRWFWRIGSSEQILIKFCANGLYAKTLLKHRKKTAVVDLISP